MNVNEKEIHMHLPPLTQEILLEPCVQGTSYDYFRESEVSYILTFATIGLAIVSIFGIIYLLIEKKERQRRFTRIEENKVTRNTFKNVQHIDDPLFVGL